MTRKSLRSQAFSSILFTLIGLVLLNIISVRVFGRLDLTEKNLFTLSQASRDLVGSLDDRIAVTAYFTEDLPSPYNNNRRAVLDQLNEYKAYSGGNLIYEFINPTGEEMEREAQQQGISPVQVQVVNEDRFEAKRAYMGLTFFYEDRKETIPVVQNLYTLEYDISSVFKRLTTQVRKKIGFLTGHGEPALSELQAVQSVLGKQYDLTTVDLSGGNSVPADIAALVVMSPGDKIPDPAQFEIDQYLMRGGRIAFLLNRVAADLQQRFGRELDSGLDDLLAKYGLKINTDLVRDTRCANISIVQQSGGFTIQSQVPFPLIPLASRFNPENMMVKDLEGVVLFFVSSVDTADLAAKNLTGDVLVTSSKQTGRLQDVFMINPLSEYSPAEFREQHVPLAVTVSGQFTSAFANREIPVDTLAPAIIPRGGKLTQGLDSRIVLVGDGDFPKDQYLGNNDNVTFFANMIDYLVDDAGLITIRSKDVTQPPLEQVSDGTKSLIKYGNLIVPPVLLVGYGLFRWRARRIRRKALEGK